jgi:2-succinyl-6-hydroxy-2,4-cyclohexadiene-1-carboxylate synthase
MLHYETTGSRDQPPVLFVHGFMGRGADWQPVLESVQDGAYAIAVDLPGHGASVDLSEDAYTMDAAVRQLVEVLEAERVDRCAVVGYSMGGRTALHLARQHPDRCRRLMLESTSPGLDTEAQRADRRCIDRRRAQQIADDFDAFLRDWYRIPLFASLAQHDLVEAMVERRRHNRPAELAKSLRGMGPGAQDSLWERLPALRIPTLALTGALDAKYVGITQRMTARAPRIRSVIIPGAGHNVHAERPQAFIDALRRFID